MTVWLEPVNPSLAPNLHRQDVWLAVKVLVQPWRWQEGDATEELKEWFKQNFGNENQAHLFASGREALWALLEACGFNSGAEVLTQAFTCAAVANAIRWAGLKPVYVDIDPSSYNLDPVDLEQKITPRSRVVIVQHTFGIRADCLTIRKITRKNKLLLIEDCAHALGAKTDQGLVGSLGQAAVFSFGRDKAFSGVWGGAVISSQPKINQQLNRLCSPRPRQAWIFQQLLHPIFFGSVILPFYRLGPGKLFLYCLQNLGLVSLPVSGREKQGKKYVPEPRAMANALACLILLQLSRLSFFTNHRRRLAKLYQKVLSNSVNWQLPAWDLNRDVPLRVPVSAREAEKLWSFARKRGVLLGRWYSAVIDPKGTDKVVLGYQPGSCPKAERAAQEIINLPVSPRTSEKDVQQVCQVIKDFYENIKS